MIKKFLQSNDIYFLPVVNPDGYEYSQQWVKLI